MDKMRCKNNKTPLFTFFTLTFKDGGTEYKTGLGYAVIIWNQLWENNLNNTPIQGYRTGKEFIEFPLCYSNLFNYKIKPKVELEFIPNMGFEELYEANKREYFNVKIIREENNGLMNLVPCNVFIYNEDMELLPYGNTVIFNIDNKKQTDRNNNDYFKLLGGETAFLTLFYGNYSMKIITPKEEQMGYLEEYDKNWESISYNFEITIDKYIEMEIVPGKDNAYNGSWIIKESVNDEKK